MTGNAMRPRSEGGIDGICILHSGLEEKISNVAADVSEIKRDMKLLITSYAGDRGLSNLGKLFAVGAGVATPLSALIWAVWRG